MENPLAVQSDSAVQEAPATEAVVPEQADAGGLVSEETATVQETSPAASPPKSVSEFIKDDWSFGEGAFEHIPLDEGENPEKYKALGNKFHSLPDLAKSYLNLERMMSKEKIPVPTDSDGDEVWDHTYRALGKPETPNYNAPEGFDPEAKKATDEIFFEANLTQRQADKIYSRIQEALSSHETQTQEAEGQGVEAAIQSLEADFGPRGSMHYQQAIEKAQIVADNLGLNDESLWKIPGFAAKLAAKHDSLIGSEIVNPNTSSTGTSQSIQDEIHAIQTDPSHRLFTAYRDGDREANNYVLGLYEKLNEKTLT